MSLSGFDPASTYQKIILYDENMSEGPYHNFITNYDGFGLDSASFVYQTNVNPNVYFPTSSTLNLRDSNTNALGTNPLKGFYLIGNTGNVIQELPGGIPNPNIGHTIVSDGLTHSYLINFFMTGRFLDSDVGEGQTNRLWIQPTFDGDYDQGIIGPGGVEVFGLSSNFSGNFNNPSSISNSRIMTAQLHYIYTSSATSWKLNFLVTARNVWNGNLADGFKFDSVWFTIKTIS